ncbi:hypothetical protein BDM02DRAFT_1352632 [Thelephora ganbajun]|uniref:Uncharacterized protein n=1 Tax=Thelephora ganbajun TaxID=370292 RepID=A0ACB6ZMI1_THEGA|nr:hypothetical protein BDM02DRAFT_1352632 [Thelephora ganbajun]
MSPSCAISGSPGLLGCRTAATSPMLSLSGVRGHGEIFSVQLLPSPLERWCYQFCKLIDWKESLPHRLLQNRRVFGRSDYSCYDQGTIDGDIHVYDCRYAGRLRSKPSETLDPRRILQETGEHFTQCSRRIRTVRRSRRWNDWDCMRLNSICERARIRQKVDSGGAAVD